MPNLAFKEVLDIKKARQKKFTFANIMTTTLGETDGYLLCGP